MNQSNPEWRIANSTLYKVVGLLVLGLVVYRLAPVFVLLALAVLVAVTLYPVIGWIERRGFPHWAASLGVSFATLTVLAGLVIGVVPALVEEIGAMSKKIPEIQERFSGYFPDEDVQKYFKSLAASSKITSVHLLSAGQVVFDSVSEIVLMLVLALYLASDGKRTYAWIRAGFSSKNQIKLDETCKEVSGIIFAYVVGQLLTSALCAVFVFIILHMLHVPAALVLAVLAAVFDVLPLIGFFLFMVPAVLFALTVSSSAALTVLVSYTAYHFLENYFIVPRVYGSRLRLSDLVVLVSVLAGAYLGGIAGAILVLPLVAAYPAFERIWLAKAFGDRVVSNHQAIENGV